MLAGYVLISMPAARMYYSSIPLMHAIAGICGAVLAALVVHAIASTIRAKKQASPPDNQDGKK